jgi:hypothetical protein
MFCAIIAATMLPIISIQNHEYPISIEYAMVALGAIISIVFSVMFLTVIYTTARQPERFDDYKAEFEKRWVRLKTTKTRQSPISSPCKSSACPSWRPRSFFEIGHRCL